MRVIFRKDLLAAAALLLIVAVPGVLMQEPLAAFAGTIHIAALYVLSIRVGLLALVIAASMAHTVSLPLTTDTSAWHAGYAYALVAVPVVLAFIAFVIAKAGRPLGRVALLD